MKRLFFISWTLFLVGLFLRFLHIGIAGYIITLGALFMFIHSAKFLWLNYKDKLQLGLLYLFSSLITIYLTIRFQYWAISSLFFIAVLGLFLIILILHFVKHDKFQIIHFLLLIYFMFFRICLGS